LYNQATFIPIQEPAMTERNRQQRERFVRIINFAVAHPDSFPDGKPAAAHIEELKIAVEKFDELSGRQDQSAGAGRALTAHKHDLVATVHDDLVGLSRTSHALEREHPGLREKFRLPSSEADEATLAAGRAALEDLKADGELVNLFLDYGMPDDFVADLERDIAAAQDADSQQDEHSGARREDTLAIAKAIQDGTYAVDKLGAYAQNAFRGDRELPGAWKSASHLELKRVHPHAPTD
jgi:hypothetical protein